MKHELTEGLLLNEQGDLNEAGFSLCPVKTYERKQIKGLKWRIKEWDYYYIGNSKYGLCLTISDVSFLALCSVTFMDFVNVRQPAKTVIKPFTFGKVGLPSSSKEGDVSYQDKVMSLSFKHENGKRHLLAEVKKFDGDKDLSADIVLEETCKDSIVVALPFFKKRPLHIQKALDVIDYHQYQPIEQKGEVLADNQYFEVERKEFDGELKIKANKGSFVSFTFIEGEGLVDDVPFQTYDTFFLPNDKVCKVKGKGIVIISRV